MKRVREPRDGGASVAARRARYALSSAVLLVAATIVCAVGGVLAGQKSVQWDATESRRYTLAARTERMLGSVAGPVEVIVCAERAAVDRRLSEGLGDLLQRMQRRQALLTWVWLDPTVGVDRAKLGPLLERLARPHAETIAEQQRTLSDVAARVLEVEKDLREISDQLKALAESGVGAGGGKDGDGESDLSRQAGLARAIAARAEPAARAIEEARTHEVESVGLPEIDAAQATAGAFLNDAARAADAVARFSAATTGPGGPLASVAARGRDRAARAGDALMALRAVETLYTARALQSGDAVIVASAARSVAIDFESMLPPVGSGPEALPDARTAEVLLATALGALSDRPTPVVVFVHAETGRLLGPSGGPTTAGARSFGKLFQRLRLAQAGAKEWAVALDELAPDRGVLDPTGKRPIVWVVLGSVSRGGDGRSAASAAARAARIAKLGAALQRLVARGDSVLVCMDSSELPGVGEADPIGVALEPLGVKCRSEAVLLRSEASPRGPLTFSYHAVKPGGAHAERGRALTESVAGLGLLLPWTTVLEVPARDAAVAEGSPAQADVFVVAAVDAGASVWGETQWVTLREAMARGAARPLDPLLLTDPPVAQPPRDLTSPPSGGAWCVVAASERQVEGAVRQRAVVVASAAWLDDALTGAAETVAGRSALLFPGNIQLFESSLLWLTGDDEGLAPSSLAGTDVPRIAVMDAGALAALRWSLVAGLPVAVLALGALLRLWRG